MAWSGLITCGETAGRYQVVSVRVASGDRKGSRCRSPAEQSGGFDAHDDQRATVV